MRGFRHAQRGSKKVVNRRPKRLLCTRRTEKLLNAEVLNARKAVVGNFQLLVSALETLAHLGVDLWVELFFMAI